MSHYRTLRHLTALAMLTTPGTLSAQHDLKPDPESAYVQLEVAKPFFPDPEFGPVFGSTSSVLNVSVVAPVRDRVAAFGSLGLAHATVEGLSSSQVISNLRLGVLIAGEGGSHGTIHVDVPVATGLSDAGYATIVGIVHDMERIERFDSDAWSVGAAVVPTRRFETGGALGLRLGATGWISTGGDDAELLVVAAPYAELPAGAVMLGGEISVLTIASQEHLSAGERTLIHATGSLALFEADGAPELFVRVPLDEDVREGLDAVVGLRMRLGG